MFGAESQQARAALDRMAAQPGLVPGSQLAVLPGVDVARLGVLHLHGSVLVDHPSPQPNAVSPELRALLAIPDAPQSGAMDAPAQNLAGKWVKLRARATRGNRSSRLLVIEARLTGQRPRPVWVHDWVWVS